MNRSPFFTVHVRAQSKRSILGLAGQWSYEGIDISGRRKGKVFIWTIIN